MQCPYCGSSVADQARQCPSCRAALFAACPQCRAEIPALARQCPSCGHAMAPAPPPGPGAAVVQPAGAAPPPRGPCGPHRNIVLGVILSICTCTIWTLVQFCQFAEDVNTHRGRQELNPLVDILLCFLTCGLWGFYVMYKYPTALAEMQREEGLPQNDLVLACILLYFFGLGFVATAILQGELNKHWEFHGQRA